MNLEFSDEQKLFRDSVDSYIARRYDFAYRTRTSASDPGFSAEVWAEMASFGWLGLPLPESCEGLGGTAVDVAILMEAFGRGLVLEPYVSTVLLSGGLIAETGTAEQRAAYLPAIARGELKIALAHGEPQAPREFNEVALQASRQGASWVLKGQKSVVMDAPSADCFVVSARVAGRPADSRGVGLFLVPREATGLERIEYRTVDGRRAANLALNGVVVDPGAWLGQSDEAMAAIEAVTDRANAAMASDALGCMQALLDATVVYTKTRVQFGQPIARNQVLRHRMARMAVCCEEARSMVLLAALRADSDPPDRARAVSGAKVKVMEAARFVAEQAVQLHGAIGMTEELAVGAYLKRILAHQAWLGTPAWHLRRYRALGQASAHAAA